jgi:formylglycine-generating enzyme required for sulfatase activity
MPFVVKKVLNRSMAKRKQDSIFSKLETLDAEFPPLKQQVEDSVRDMPIAVPAAVAEHRVFYQPEPVETEENLVISGETSGRTASLASFESSFVLIAPGTFPMGSPEYETGRSSDEIIHEVTLTKGFYMQKTLVTQGQWKALMDNNPASFSDGGDDCPIESVSWNECQEFIRRLNAGKDSIYRLPTEAEWEYACRARSSTPFCGGEISALYCANDPILSEAGWYCGNSGRQSRPVAQKSPNVWGLYDMHGNVSEWCRDWYGEYGPNSQTDPLGPQSGSAKVIRGGSWFSNAKNCRSASRFYWPPNSRSEFIGFRLVKEIF